MKYPRYYADEHGGSRTEEIPVELTPRDFAPPAPPLHISPLAPASGIGFVRFPAGWDAGWHPTPRRQFFVFLAGELEGETSDGTRRQYLPGSVALLEDTTGIGHRARVIGSEDVLAMVIQLAD
jgi:hypothetical protein